MSHASNESHEPALPGHVREERPKASLATSNWVGMILIGLMPAGGFGAWAWQMGERVAKLEERAENRHAAADSRHEDLLKVMDALTRSLEKTSDRVADSLPRLDQRLVEIERRLERLDEAGGKRGS